MSRLYLDANVVIDLIEEEPARRNRALRTLAANAGPDAEYVVSDLVRLECQVKPIAADDQVLLDAYERYFGLPTVTVVGLPAPVYDRAARIRARFRYGLADSLHLAAAVEAGCATFVTGDRRLVGFPDITVALVGAP